MMLSLEENYGARCSELQRLVGLEGRCALDHEGEERLYVQLEEHTRPRRYTLDEVHRALEKISHLVVQQVRW